MFPAFGLGALALPMGADLGFTEAGLGSAVAVFFLLAAVTSPHAGTLTDRLGPQRSLRVANLCSGRGAAGDGLRRAVLLAACWWHWPSGQSG